MLRGIDKINLQGQYDAFDYQQEAVERVKDLKYAALFHEQGLGKTKIALDLALHWLKEDIVDSVLIIAKKGLIKNWEKETKTHTQVDFSIIGGNKLKNGFSYNRPYRIYIAHYEAIHSNRKKLNLFLQTRRVGTILDEAHHMKNPNGRVATALFGLSSKFTRRVIMTGTPVANRPYDIWSPVFFLDQGQSLGDDFDDFKKKYDLPKDVINQPDYQYERQLEEIFKKIKSFTVRETKKSAGIELPEKHISNHLVKMKDKQATLYDKFKNEIYVDVFKDGKIKQEDVSNILTQMLRLVQTASNPLMIDESYDDTPCKLTALESILADMPNQEKAIIWTNFIKNADWLTSHFKEWGALKIHGKLDMESRNRSVERFLNDSDKRLLIATPGAAKEGLTLTVANHAIFFDRNFSLNDWLQAQDRIHRISQTQPCQVIHLIAENSIDEWIDRLLKCKNRFAGLVQGDITAQKGDESIIEDSNVIAEKGNISAMYEFNSIVEEILKP